MGAKKRKKIIWNNNDCKAAENCKRPESTSTWVKCDNCKGWFHIVCVGLTQDDLNDRDWFCPPCDKLKIEEYNMMKDKLIVKVEELAKTQQDFGGLTIPRDMFKDRKNATSFNFSTAFPPTLMELCKRVKSKYKTISDFKFEYIMMCKKLKSELLDNYASQVQYVEYELDDILDDLLKVEEPEPEPALLSPEDLMSTDEEAGDGFETPAEPEPEPPSLAETKNLSFSNSSGQSAYVSGLMKIKQEKIHAIDLGVDTIETPDYADEPQEDHFDMNPNPCEDSTSMEDDLSPAATLQQEEPQQPEVDSSNCRYCSKEFTIDGIYSCKRDHQICVNCRMVIPGCICPVCYNEFGDRRRLALDHSANIRQNIEKNGIQSAINSMKEPIPRSRLGKGLRVSKGRGNQGGWSGVVVGSGSPILVDRKSPGTLTSNKRKEMDDSEEGGGEASSQEEEESGFGIGRVWSCLSSSSEPRMLTASQIKQEKHEALTSANIQETLPPPTPSIDLSATGGGEGEMGVVETARVLTMLHADVCAEAPLASSSKSKPKQAPKRGKSEKAVEMNLNGIKSQLATIAVKNTEDGNAEQLEFINSQISLRLREVNRLKKHISQLKGSRTLELNLNKIKNLKLEVKQLSELMTSQIQQDSPSKCTQSTKPSPIGGKASKLNVTSPPHSAIGGGAVKRANNSTSTSSSFSSSRTFSKPRIIRARKSSNETLCILPDKSNDVVNRSSHDDISADAEDLPEPHAIQIGDAQTIIWDGLEPIVMKGDPAMLPTGSNPYHSNQVPLPANNQYQELPQANTNEYHLPPTNSQYHPVMSTAASNGHLGIPTSSIVTNPSVSCQQQQQPSLLETAFSQAKLIQSQKAAAVQNQKAVSHQLQLSSGGQRRNSSLVVEDASQASTSSMAPNLDPLPHFDTDVPDSQPAEGFIDMSVSMGDLICEPVVVSEPSQDDQEESSTEVEKIDHQQVIDLMRQQLVANPEDFSLGEGEAVEGGGGWLGEGEEGVGWDGEGEEEEDLDECRREHLCFQEDGEHKSEGVLPLFILADPVSTRGLHWESFLIVYAPQLQGTFYFDVGKAGKLFYLRAYSDIPSPGDYSWRITVRESNTMNFEGVFSAEDYAKPRVLPAHIQISHNLPYTITIKSSH